MEEIYLDLFPFHKSCIKQHVLWLQIWPLPGSIVPALSRKVCISISYWFPCVFVWGVCVCACACVQFWPHTSSQATKRLIRFVSTQLPLPTVVLATFVYPLISRSITMEGSIPASPSAVPHGSPRSRHHPQAANQSGINKNGNWWRTVRTLSLIDRCALSLSTLRVLFCFFFVCHCIFVRVAVKGANEILQLLLN